MIEPVVDFEWLQEHRAEVIVADALQFAESSTVPEPADAFTDVFI